MIDCAKRQTSFDMWLMTNFETVDSRTPLQNGLYSLVILERFRFDSDISHLSIG
jgi:hypothetical protein